MLHVYLTLDDGSFGRGAHIPGAHALHLKVGISYPALACLVLLKGGGHQSALAILLEPEVGVDQVLLAQGHDKPVAPSAPPHPIEPPAMAMALNGHGRFVALMAGMTYKVGW